MGNIAVIMSVYHSDKLEYLQLAVDSILSQTYSNSDIFLYRDGTVTSEVQAYLDTLESSTRVNVFQSDANAGLAKALNQLIDIVMDSGRYEYIARMDSDDVSHTNRLEKQISFLNANQHVDVCGTFCREFGASFAMSKKTLPVAHQELRKFSIYRCPFVHPSVVFRSSVFESGVRYPVDTHFTEDMALWFDLLHRGFVFANLGEVLLDYRLNENTVKRRKGIRKAISEINIRLKYMFLLREFSLKNFVLIFSRVLLHLAPSASVKFLYKKAR